MTFVKHNIYLYFEYDLVCEVRILGEKDKKHWKVQTPFGTRWIHESKLHERKETHNSPKICHNCGRSFVETEVPSGKFCCIACEYGY